MRVDSKLDEPGSSWISLHSLNWWSSCCRVQAAPREEELAADRHSARDDRRSRPSLQLDSADEAEAAGLGHVKLQSTERPLVKGVPELKGCSNLDGDIFNMDQCDIERNPSTTAPSSPESSPDDEASLHGRSSLASKLHMEPGPCVVEESKGVKDIVVKTALRAGRVKQVESRLKELEQAGQGDVSRHVHEFTAERLKRIVECFDKSLKELQQEGDGDGTPDWRKESKKHAGDIDLAFRLADDHIQVVASRDLAVDALHAFVGLSEFDLSHRYCGKTEGVHLLQRAGTGDSLWRLRKSGAQGKEDNILHVSAVDALDEPLGALWLSVYTPGTCSSSGVSEGTPGTPRLPRHGAVEVNGMAVPPPQDGCVRADFWKSVFIITPVWGKGGIDGRPPACRLTVGLCRRATSASCVFPSFVRKETEALITGIHNFLQHRSELSWRTIASPSSVLYDFVRDHLQEKKPPGNVAIKPLVRMSCSDLTAYLPTNWAEFCEPLKGACFGGGDVDLDGMEYCESACL